MQRIQYISVQPAIPYYAWQVEVMLDNFLSRSIAPEQIHVLYIQDAELPWQWQKLIAKYPTVNFWGTKDERLNRLYICSTQPHALKKYWVEHPWLEYLPIFYHDCDILFIQPPSAFLQSLVDRVSDDRWFMSDCRGYLGQKYLQQKAEEGELDMNLELRTLCERLKIDPKVLYEMDPIGVGGAQHLMKGVTAQFWHDCEWRSEIIYHAWNSMFHGSLNQRFFKTEASGVQSFTSGMWALLWSAWNTGKRIETPSQLNFCWATDKLGKLPQNAIYHNAGATDSTPNIFQKYRYMQETPYLADLSYVSSEHASSVYATAIKRAAQSSCLL